MASNSNITKQGFRAGLNLVFASLLLLPIAIWVAGCRKSDQARESSDRSTGLTAVQEAYWERVKDDVLATIAERDVTREMVMIYNQQTRVAPLSQEDIARRPPETLRPILEHMAATRRAAEEASLLPEAQTDAAQNMIRQQVEFLLTTLLLQKEVKDNLPTPTERDLRNFYEENSEGYSMPFHFSMRHIFVSNYAPVLTQPGDTLEGLAQRISGDIAMAGGILVDNPIKSPRAPRYGEPDAVIPELRPGENLLVPMGPEGRARSMEKIRVAKERLDAGESFEAVEAELSESGQIGELIQNVGLSGRPVLPSIMEAARKTPVGGASDIFETKHGYNIILIVEKNEEGPRPFDDVREDVERVVRARNDREATMKYVAGLFEMPEFVIDMQAIKNPDTDPDTIVATLGEKQYTKAELEQPLLGDLDPDVSNEDVLDVLRSDRRLQQDLIIFEARKQGIDKSGRYQALVDTTINTEKRRLYTEYLEREKSREEISEEEALAYFEANPDYFLWPKSYSYYLLTRQLPDVVESELSREEMETRTQAELAAMVAGIRTLAEFRALAAQHANPEVTGSEDGFMRNVPETRIGPQLRAVLEELQPGQMSAPVTMGAVAGVVWLVETQEPRPASREDYNGQLAQVVKQVQMNRLRSDLHEEWLSKAMLEIR